MIENEKKTYEIVFNIEACNIKFETCTYVYSKQKRHRSLKNKKG